MTPRRWCFALPLCAALLGGCAATMADYEAEGAITARLPAEDSRAIDVPKRFFDDILPRSLQRDGLGIINTQAQFSALWELYARDATALPPSIDFEDTVLLFVYDPVYYNLVRFKGLNVWKGIANPFVERTKWKLSLEGDPTLRKIRKAAGENVPEPKVNVALLQIPRNRPGRPGVTAILVGADGEVIPVPPKP